MSVIYFCPEFICCPYYRGVRYSGVSARRELTVINSVIHSGIPFPHLFFTRVCFKFFSFVASQMSKIKQKRKKMSFTPTYLPLPQKRRNFSYPVFRTSVVLITASYLVPVVKEFFTLSLLSVRIELVVLTH